jgi:DNA-binding transcriptional LysR family regulator
LTEVDQPTGELGFGLAQSAARLFGADILQRYLSAHARVHLHIIEEISDVLVSKVATGEIDVAIVSDDAVTPNMSSRRLAREPIALIGAPSLFVELPARITPATVAKLPLIVPRHASGSRALLERSLATLQKSLTPYLACQWTVVWLAERPFTAAPRKLVQLSSDVAAELIGNGRWAAK